MKHILLIAKVVFWMTIAYIPLAIDSGITNFMVSKCVVGSECLKHAMPLIVQISLVGWATRILLWPLVTWHLGGQWLWQRFYLDRLPKPNPSANNA